MITPVFSVTQDNRFLTITIKAPYCNISSADIFIEDTCFKFFAKPYFLRLHFSGNIKEDEKSKCSFDSDLGEFKIKVTKCMEGEDFKGLELLTKLLTPSNASTKKPLIEVLNDVENDKEIPNKDEIDYNGYFQQELPLKNLDNKCNINASFGYGFANQRFNVFSKLQGDPFEVLCLKDPDSKSVPMRKVERVASEIEKFDSDHYLADLYENEQILELLELKLPLNDRKFSSEHKTILKDLPRKEYLLEKPAIEQICFSLVDLLFAYAFNYRSTEAEYTIESPWNIRTISATLSWCETFSSLHETLITCYRRSLCFPLQRNFRLSQCCHSDVEKILKCGKIPVIKCLLDIYKLFQTHEQFNLLNDLYITDYIVWIQSVNDSALEALADAVHKTKITKSNLDLELSILEEAAEMVLQDENNEQEKSEEESSEYTSTDEEDESVQITNEIIKLHLK